MFRWIANTLGFKTKREFNETAADPIPQSSGSQGLGKLERQPHPTAAIASARIREIVLDTETTGLSPRAGHRLISISLIEVFNAEEIGSRLDLMIDPCRAIPPE